MSSLGRGDVDIVRWVRRWSDVAYRCLRKIISLYTSRVRDSIAASEDIAVQCTAICGKRTGGRVGGMLAIGGRTPGTMNEGTHAGVADRDDAHRGEKDYDVGGCC